MTHCYEATVIDWLYHLPVNIRSRALYNALMSSNYQANCNRKVDSLKKALTCAFDFWKTDEKKGEGFIFWNTILDNVGNAEPVRFMPEPCSA